MIQKILIKQTHFENKLFKSELVKHNGNKAVKYTGTGAKAVKHTSTRADWARLKGKWRCFERSTLKIFEQHWRQSLRLLGIKTNVSI